MHYMFYKAVLYCCDGDVEKQGFIIKIKLVNYFGAFLSHLAKLVLYANINRLRDAFNETMKKLQRFKNKHPVYSCKFIQFKRHSETN